MTTWFLEVGFRDIPVVCDTYLRMKIIFRDNIQKTREGDCMF